MGSSGRLVTLKQVQLHVTRAAFLDHTHHLHVHSQLRPRKAPSAPSPMALPGLPPTPAWSIPLMSPAASPGAPTCPRQAVCSVLGRPPWCQVDDTRGTHGASLTQHSGQHPPTDHITLDGQGFRESVASPGSHFIPALPTGKLLSNSVPAAQRGHSYTRPPPSTRGSRGRAPPRIWSSPGQVPSSPRGSHGQAPSRIWSSPEQIGRAHV